MKFLFVVTLLAVLCVNYSIQKPTQVILTSVYYEALCPSSADFIKEQLYPAYAKIGSSLHLDFVPYGNVVRKEVNGTWTFNCQHGPTECAFNKLQACAISKIEDRDKQMEFVYCVENAVEDYDLEETAEKCAPKVGLTDSELLKCSKGPEGYELFVSLSKKHLSIKPKIEYVPWILFNGEQGENTQEAARDNFLETVCSIFTDKPAGCSDI